MEATQERPTFLVRWRQYAVGEAVPDTLDYGTVDALQRRGIVSRPKDAVPGRDKMVRKAKRQK